MATRRTRILDAAAALLTADGPSGLSMRRLAEAAAVSVNTIYNLIGSREDVVAALVDRVIGLIAPTVDDVDGGDPVDRCVAVITRSAETVIEQHALTRPLAQEIFGHGGPGSEVSRRWGTATLRRAVDDAVAAGVFIDRVPPSALAETVYAVWANAALSWAHGMFDDEEFVVAALHGLHLALFAVASDDTRPHIEHALDDTGSRLAATLEPATDPPARRTA